MARLLQRLPSRQWLDEDGQKVFVRFERRQKGREKISSIKFLWRDPGKGADGIHSAWLALLDLAARINGAVDQEESIFIIEQLITQEEEEHAQDGERSRIFLPLAVAIEIKQAAEKFFIGQ